jgi:hypothetical protein
MRTVLLKQNSLIRRHTPAWCLACAVTLLIPSTAAAQAGRLAIEYTVKVADIPGQLFHVTTDIKNINQPTLDLSLPVWTPGWYVSRTTPRTSFASGPPNLAAGSCGRRRCASRPGESTRGGSRGSSSNSTIGRPSSPLIRRASRPTTRSSPARSSFCCRRATDRGPAWCGSRSRTAGASPADSTRRPAPTVFTAPDYDTLVDQPTLMGQFDVTRFTIEGKPHEFVAQPAGVFSAEKDPHADRGPDEAGGNTGQDLWWPAVSEIRLLVFLPACGNECDRAGAPDSYVALMNAGAQTQPDAMVTQAAHEFFHVWNVKRIRPVQMWPYDYSRENETPLLWVSEALRTTTPTWRGTAPG